MSKETPTSIPAIPLKIVTIALIVLFVVVPSFVALTRGQIGEMPFYIAAGLTLVAVTLATMFIQRIFLWVFYRFYWYIMAALLFPAIICAVTWLPTINTSQFAPLSQLPIIEKSLFVPGAIVGIVAIVWAFRYGKQKPTAKQPDQQPPEAAPESAPKQILDSAHQLAVRKQKLGVGREIKTPKK